MSDARSLTNSRSDGSILLPALNLSCDYRYDSALSRLIKFRDMERDK
jgi:hypothetical protein